MSEALVLISTADSDVPVIVEHPTEDMLNSPEYRRATDEEYERYHEWWLGYLDADEKSPMDERHASHPMYLKGYEEGTR